MEVQLLDYDFDSNSYQGNTYLDVTIPTKCPHCNYTGIQEFINGTITGRDKNIDYYDDLFPFISECIITTACHFCKKFTHHILGYRIDYNSSENTCIQYTKQTIPEFKTSSFNISSEIIEQYPDFIRIYTQANLAYESKLNDLAGVGYRKAIEFLVTEYLLKKHDTSIDEKWLKDYNTSLSQKINKLNKPRLVTLGRAIAYLGNDETHYTKRHKEYCIKDLQSFIKLFISEIEGDLIFENATKLVSKK